MAAETLQTFDVTALLHHSPPVALGVDKKALSKILSYPLSLIVLHPRTIDPVNPNWISACQTKCRLKECSLTGEYNLGITVGEANDLALLDVYDPALFVKWYVDNVGDEIEDTRINQTPSGWNLLYNLRVPGRIFKRDFLGPYMFTECGFTFSAGNSFAIAPGSILGKGPQFKTVKEYLAAHTIPVPAWLLKVYDQKIARIVEALEQPSGQVSSTPLVPSAMSNRSPIDVEEMGELVTVLRDKTVYDLGSGTWWSVQPNNLWSCNDGSSVDKALDAKYSLVSSEVSSIAHETSQAKNLRAYHRWIGSYRTRMNIVGLCRRQAYLGVPGIIWDDTLDLLPCKNMVLQLDRKRALIHAVPISPDMHLTKVAPVEWELGEGTFDADMLNIQDARCYPFLSALRDIFPGSDHELLLFWLRVIGSTLSGASVDNKVFFWYGPAASNGKSLLLDILSLVLGPFAKTVKSALILSRREVEASNSHDGGVLQLRGLKLAAIEEIPEGQKLNEEILKRTSERRLITARAPHAAQATQFWTTHVLHVLTNTRPFAQTDDCGLWRRVVEIPFRTRFLHPADYRKASAAGNLCENDKAANPFLRHTLGKDLWPILVVLLTGWIDWAQSGLCIPREVEDATTDYRKETDVVSSFLEECTYPAEPRARGIKASDLYAVYKSWSEKNGHRPKSNIAFGRSMSHRGINRVRSGSGMLYSLRIKAESFPYSSDD